VIFDYPNPRSERKHAPAGYAEYESYRPWLRDEFDFRCAYCLKRETWGQITGEFELDHFQPQSLFPQGRVDYQNLVYACRRCNAVKGSQTVEDPFRLLRARLVSTLTDGTLKTDDSSVRVLIRQLDLNSPKLKKWRVMWMRIVGLAKSRDVQLYYQLVGFPADLPNLNRRRPPRNPQKESTGHSWFAQRERGVLPAEY
jgi:hypothetical protein